MNQYTFKIELIGYGDTLEEAWEDAQQAFDIDEESLPDAYVIEEHTEE